MDDLGTLAGGPDAVDAGETQVATAKLRPGRYAFICLLPDAKGRAHAGLGMVKALTVTSENNGASVPAADYSASAKDFDFTFPDAWSGTIRFTNKGKQNHEYQVMEIACEPDVRRRPETGDVLPDVFRRRPEE